ncbi:MAG: zinc ribbon domain-containing protein [Acidiferrobacteraceae bacterium]
MLRQMRLTRQYRNNLIAIELERRAAVERALLMNFPLLAKLDSAVAAIEAELEKLRSEAKRSNAEQRSKRVSADAKAAIADAKKRLAAARSERKAERTAAFESLTWERVKEHIDAHAAARIKDARKHCGLYWGTYIIIEQSLMGIRSGAPPKMGRQDDKWTIAVQIQGGLSPAEAYAGNDTRLRIKSMDAEIEAERGRKLGRHLRNTISVSMRIGTDEHRQPIWCRFLSHHSKPQVLPEDSRIKWAYLTARRRTTGIEWQFRLAVARKGGWLRDDVAKYGAVGVDIGWRLVEEGLRVAYWVGDDGQEGQIILPNRRTDDDWDYLRRKATDLHSIRDQRFNQMRDRLADWIVARSDAGLPDVLIEAGKSLRLWKSKRRFGKLVEKSLAGVRRIDPEMAAALDEWWAKERHLWRWAEDNERHFRCQRIDIYRKAAAMLARKYRLVIVEDFDLSQVQRTKPVEEASGEDAAIRKHQRDANCSELRRCLVERFAESLKVESARTTMECHACGAVTDFDHAVLLHTCDCGAKWDQDANAARNILRRGLASGAAAAK